MQTNHKIPNIYDVTKRLIGQIKPQGDASIDDDIHENLKLACELVGDLFTDIMRVAEDDTRHEYSVKRSGIFAREFVKSIEEQIAEVNSMNDNPLPEYEYEHPFVSDEGEPCPIDGWMPITTERIKHPEKIEEYIALGRLRRIKTHV